MRKTLNDICLKFTVVRKMMVIVIYYVISNVLTKPIWSLFEKKLTENNQTELEIFFEILIYFIIFVFVFALTIPDIVDEYKRTKEKKIGRFFAEVGIGLGISYLLMVIGSFVSSMITGDFSSSSNENAIDAMMYNKYSMLLIPTLCLIGPIVEEIVFRKSIQEGLIKIHVHPIVAILISGILFGFLHVMAAGDYAQVFSYLFLGLWFGYMYYYSNNLMTTISIHFLINSFSTSLQYILIVYELIMKQALK